MNVLECVRFATEFLCMTTLSDYIDGGCKDSLSDNDMADYTSLCMCSITVLHEVATELVPLTDEADIEIVDGKISYDMFPYTAIEILKVVKEGKRVPITSYYNGICLNETGTVTVTYNRLPYLGDMYETLDWKDSRVNARNIGLGIAAEFSLKNGMVDDAIIWDKRYKDSLAASLVVNRPQSIKRRRWL